MRGEREREGGRREGRELRTERSDSGRVSVRVMELLSNYL